MAKANKTTNKRVIWFPGETTWEQWFVAPGREPELISQASERERSFALNDRGRRILAMPVASVVALPLLSNATDESGLAGTAQMHAERSGVNEDLHGVGFELLSGAPPNSLIRVEAPLNSSAWDSMVSPDTVCSSATLLPWEGDSVAIWRELGQLVVGFSKNSRIVFFDRLSTSNIGAETGTEIQRLLFQLNCQGIEIHPSELKVWTADGDMTALQAGSGLIIQQFPSRPAPTSDVSCQLAPAWLRSGREKSEQRRILRKRFGAFAAAVIVVIGAFAAMGAVESFRQKGLRDRISDLAPVAGRIENMKAQWEEVAPAVDREATPLEMLKSIQEMNGAGGVSFSRFEIEDGKIIIAGESASPRAALQFLDSVSLSEKMADYGWEFDQPVIRANGSAAFQIEGTK